MKVLCAPDSFKETISALDAAQAMAEGVRRAEPDAAIDICPVGDGGEGTLEALTGGHDGSIHRVTVTGPLGQCVEASYGVIEDGSRSIGVVELAQASGLALIPRDTRDPTRTTTFGTGELINHAAARGCDEIIVTIGGSGTVDGGAGIAQALGVIFLDERDEPIHEPMTGGLLSRVRRIDRRATARAPRLRIACDVTNPLCGPNGAAAVYGPQKGATPAQVKLLDAALAHLAALLGADPDTPGFGAAGGAALALVALFEAKLERGIDLVLQALRFEDRCRDADLVLTGEGSLDAQSLHGKAALGVARAASRCGVPTIALVGRTGEGAERCVGPGLLAKAVSMADRCGIDAAMNAPAHWLAILAAEAVTGTRNA